MDLCQALADSVRLELNHIYTEKPFHTNTGVDMGWFCREHALQLGGLAAMLGYQVQLCCGDIVVNVPRDIKISTLGSGNDHAWCCINGKAPFDASVTLKHLAPTKTDVRAVCPNHPEYLSGFNLRYERGLSDVSFANVLKSSDPIIAYSQKSVVPYGPVELLGDPFKFLHRPALGQPTFTELFGDDVFFAITAHLYKVARGEVKPMRTYRAPKDAIKGILKHNSDARAFVTGTANERAI